MPIVQWKNIKYFYILNIKDEVDSLGTEVLHAVLLLSLVPEKSHLTSLGPDSFFYSTDICWSLPWAPFYWGFGGEENIYSPYSFGMWPQRDRNPTTSWQVRQFTHIFMSVAPLSIKLYGIIHALCPRHNIIKNVPLPGSLAGSVGGACNSWS